MDRPFREIHELYKILYDKAEVRVKEEKERKEQERQEEEMKRRGQMPRKPADDLNRSITPSPAEAAALEDVFEELAEGGVM